MRNSRFAVGALAILALDGCETTTRIDAQDNRVFLPALRAGINLGESRLPPSQPQSGHAIELGIAKARGSDTQSLAAGEPPVILNGTTFAAPQELRNDFDVYFADISWRWRKFFGERSLGLETLAGAGYSSLDLSVSTPAQSASEHFGTWGPQGGIGLIWRLRPSTSVQARVQGFLSRADAGVNRMARFDLSLAKAFHDNLTLRAGYAGWEMKGQGQTDMSDFRLRFSGPFLGLDLNFSGR